MAEKRLSLCMVTSFYPPYYFGGDAMHVYRLSNALARRGHEVTVVHSVDAYWAVGGPPPVGEFPNEPGVTVVPLSTRVPLASALTTYLSGRPGLLAEELRSVLDYGSFDVINYHFVSLLGGPHALSYGTGVKLYTLHEHWLVCPMQTLWKDNREVCLRPRCFRCSLSYRRPPQLWRYTRLMERSLAHVDLFLAPSAFAAEEHARRGLDLSVRVLPYFLPDEPVPAPPGGAAPRVVPQRPYFLYVGRLERLKGVQTLLDVFARYDAADLVIAGDGHYDEPVREAAARLPHVHYLGFLHPSALRELYAGALAVLLPSLGYETFGVVALEAFAEGTPVIARDRGALSEVVAASGGGLTYRSDDDLVAAMDRLRCDEELQRSLATRGQQALRERWSEEAHVGQYFEAIETARARRALR